MVAPHALSSHSPLLALLLYARGDTNARKFLDFERWWGGYYLMTKEEIREIVNNLFLGNRLARGLVLPGGRTIDLKRIARPVVVFASWGDNISPPQQALNWIADVYGHEDLIVGLGHTIVYLLDQDVGHLGIFVGGRVARKEHRELIAVMDVLDDLPPGLYEMVIEQRPRHGLAEPADSDTYIVRFETRTVADIRALNPDHRAAEPLFSTPSSRSRRSPSGYTSRWPVRRYLPWGPWSRRSSSALAPAARAAIRHVRPQPVPRGAAVPCRLRP